MEFKEFLESSQPEQDFTQRTSEIPAGSFPFGCDQLNPCGDVLHQTCGCKNRNDPESTAIVYNVDKTGEQCKDSTELNLKIQDLIFFTKIISARVYDEEAGVLFYCTLCLKNMFCNFTVLILDLHFTFNYQL